MRITRERKLLWLAIAGSLFVHLLVAFSLAAFGRGTAPLPEPEDAPVELTMMDLSPRRRPSCPRSRPISKRIRTKKRRSNRRRRPSNRTPTRSRKARRPRAATCLCRARKGKIVPRLKRKRRAPPCLAKQCNRNRRSRPRRRWRHRFLSRAPRRPRFKRRSQSLRSRPSPPRYRNRSSRRSRSSWPC